VALQERVTTLEKRIAEVVELQARNERGLDRLETQAAADREQAKTDLEDFREAMRQSADAFGAQLRADTEKFKEASARGNEAVREASRLDNEAFREAMRQSADTFGAQLRADTGVFKVEMRESASRFAAGLRADTDAFRIEVRASLEASSQIVERMSKQWGDLANRFGTVAEDIVAPNIPTLARLRFGIPSLDYFALRVKATSSADPTVRREFDIVAYSAAHFLLVDVKSTPTIETSERFLSRLPTIADFFPQAAGKELVPIVASFRIDPGIETYLTRHGVYAMAMHGETMDLSNFEAVQAARRRP
jgi:uncharacterized coiled-coil protein SlyX